MLKNYDLIIIGAGPSGIYASFLANLHNIKVLILEASSEIGGQMKLFLDKPVFDMPGHINVNGKDIMFLLNKQMELNKNYDISYNEEVVKIDGELMNFLVKTRNKVYSCKTVIIASGGGLFQPIPLGIKNEASYDNLKYKIIDSKKYIKKKLVIFGGGDTAIDWAHFFFSKGSDVTIIHRRDTFRSQEKLLNDLKKNIDILTPYKIKEIIGKKNIERVKVENIKTKETKEIYCDYVLVFFGQRKIVSKNNPFNLNCDNRGYYVSSRMETSRKGIFAIGNEANYIGKVKMMITGLGEAATAVGSVVEKLKPGKKMSYYVKKKED